MIAAIALSGLIGTWACVTEDTKTKALYTLRANHTGTLVWTGAKPPITRRFTFALNDGGDLEEHFTASRTAPELHRIRLSGKHLVDEVHVYWYEGQWTPVPLQTVLDCRR